MATLGMLEKIDTWLTGDRNYNTGYEILQAGGASAFVLRLLGSGPDHVNTPKLLTEINKLRLRTKPAPAPVKVEPVAVLVQVPTEQQPLKASDPNLDQVLRVKAQIKQLWKEICHLHGQLGIIPEGRSLYECARDIKLKDLKRKDLHQQLNYFEANGVWFNELAPVGEQDGPDLSDPLDLEREIKNAMSNRSKAAGQLKRPLPVAIREYHQQRHDKFDSEVKRLQAKRHVK